MSVRKRCSSASSGTPTLCEAANPEWLSLRLRLLTKGSLIYGESLGIGRSLAGAMKRPEGIASIWAHKIGIAKVLHWQR